MFEIHARLGELLVVLYLGVAIGALFLARRRGLPRWVTATAHALLGVQVITGIVLYFQSPDVMPLSHIIIGLLTLPALGLAVPIGRRLGRPRGIAITAFVVAILITVNVIIGMTR